MAQRNQPLPKNRPRLLVQPRVECPDYQRGVVDRPANREDGSRPLLDRELSRALINVSDASYLGDGFKIDGLWSEFPLHIAEVLTFVGDPLCSLLQDLRQAGVVETRGHDYLYLR